MAARSESDQAHDTEPGEARGRVARRPTRIPPSGWLDVAARIPEELSRDRVGLAAAGVAFFLLLALFPSIAAFVSIYGLVTDPAELGKHLDALDGLVPSAVLSVIRSELERITSAQTGTLGLSFLVSVALSLWSANRGVSAFFAAMNIAYTEEESRGFVRLTLTSLAFTVGGILLAVLVLNAVVVAPILLGVFGLSGGARLAGLVAVPVAMVIVVALAVSALYRWGPSRRPANWSWISVGSVFASAGWLLLSAAFAFYLSNFGNYGATYGSLGAVVGLMMWLYISAYVVILGAEINAELERQTRHDTTVGPDRPMGERGAYAADTLGRTRDE